jgi:hypothetical protein
VGVREVVLAVSYRPEAMAEALSAMEKTCVRRARGSRRARARARNRRADGKPPLAHSLSPYALVARLAAGTA